MIIIIIYLIWYDGRNKTKKEKKIESFSLREKEKLWVDSSEKGEREIEVEVEGGIVLINEWERWKSYKGVRKTYLVIVTTLS